MESRSTDVYVAQCFANGETGLNGKQALLAWKIDSGSWNGVKLDGLHVAGAVTANATLGDPYGDPLSGKGRDDGRRPRHAGAARSAGCLRAARGWPALFDTS